MLSHLYTRAQHVYPTPYRMVRAYRPTQASCFPRSGSELRMTTTKHTQMARATRPRLLELTSAKARTDDELRVGVALRLEGPVLQTVLLELTAQGFDPATVRADDFLSGLPAAGMNAHWSLSSV